MKSKFLIGDFSSHIEGDKDCEECWRDFPTLCKCGGLIHNNFVDEIWTGKEEYIIMKYICDKCGNDDYE